LAETLSRKFAIALCFIFPPYLSTAATLLREIRNPEIASVHLNAECCIAKPQPVADCFFNLVDS